MSAPSSGSGFDRSSYQRPQQTWVCGHHAEGHPCPIGSSGRGECLADQICTPWHDGSAWHCTRPRAWGGRCSDGPVPDSNEPDKIAYCPHKPVLCQPVRNLRSKRHRVTAITAVAALGCCLIILGGSSGSSGNHVFDTTALISPGSLSAHHATTVDGCAACHSAAAESPASLMGHLFGGTQGITESNRCLKCHTEFGEHPLQSHSVAPAILASLTEATLAENRSASETSRPMLDRVLPSHHATADGQLACSVCHHEHRGADASLIQTTNRQCQVCHASTFESFAHGHPEFAPWRRSALYFDHGTHLHQHFPASEDSGSSQVVTCNNCHTPDETGSDMILAGFEVTCAKCHGAQIADDERPPALRIPGETIVTLNLAALAPFDAALPWPQPAFDRQAYANRYDDLPPFMEALLLADDDAEMALQSLGSWAQGEALRQSDARKLLTTAIRKLFGELSSEGAAAIEARLRDVLPDHSFARSEVSALATELQQSGFFVAVESLQIAWFSTSEGEAEAEKSHPQLAGPWQVSGDGLSLVYRARGHADPLLKSLITFSAAAATRYPLQPVDGPEGVFDRLFQRLAAPEATGRCLKCHTVAEAPAGGLAVHWQSDHAPPHPKSWTRFAHRPHLTALAAESAAGALEGAVQTRCETCHALAEFDVRPPRKSEFLLPDWMPNPDDSPHAAIGVMSVRRQSCIGCHTEDLAGNNCVQCHNYHVHPDSFDSR